MDANNVIRVVATTLHGHMIHVISFIQGKEVVPGIIGPWGTINMDLPVSLVSSTSFEKKSNDVIA